MKTFFMPHIVISLPPKPAVMVNGVDVYPDIVQNVRVCIFMLGRVWSEAKREFWDGVGYQNEKRGWRKPPPAEPPIPPAPVDR